LIWYPILYSIVPFLDSNRSNSPVFLAPSTESSSFWKGRRWLWRIKGRFLAPPHLWWPCNGRPIPFIQCYLSNCHVKMLDLCPRRRKTITLVEFEIERNFRGANRSFDGPLWYGGAWKNIWRRMALLALTVVSHPSSWWGSPYHNPTGLSMWAQTCCSDGSDERCRQGFDSF